MDYFTWLQNLIGEDRGGQDSTPYSQLLVDLFSIGFYYLISQDENCAEYATELRNIFTQMGGKHHPGIAHKPISCLEVMISMAVNAEDSLMTNTDLGDRTGQWFWMMIDNLGFTSFTDDVYDVDVSIAVRSKMAAVLDRRYSSNGDGSIFPIRHPKQDMRNVDLWSAFMLYLAENYDE
jgi:hypothetical protein